MITDKTSSNFDISLFTFGKIEIVMKHKRDFMINSILLLTGSITVIIWGIAHILPAISVIMGFGDISADNKKILKMEWVTKGFSLILAIADQTILTKHSFVKIGSDIRKDIIVQLFAFEPVDGSIKHFLIC